MYKIFLLGFFSVPWTVQAHRWTHYGLRPLGMGNAFVAVADDYNALFYNPAGLKRLKTWDLEILNPGVVMAKNSMDFFSELKDLGVGGTDGTEKIIDLIESQSGKNQHFSLFMTPHFVSSSGIGVGLGLEILSEMVFHRYPSVDIQVGPQFLLPVSFAFDVVPDIISIGASLKVRGQGGVDQTFNLSDFDVFNKKDDQGTLGEEEPTMSDYVQGGIGYGSDFGILFTPVKTLKPTLGLSITDIGGTPYSKFNVGGKAIQKPNAVLPSVNMGASIRPIDGDRLYLLTSVDVHSANQPFSFSKKLGMGAELGLGNIFKFQTGIYHGYLSAGVQIDVKLLKIRAVTYAEELGESSGQQPDRRYALQFKLLI